MRAVVCVRPVPVQSQVVFSMGVVDGTEAERQLAAAEGAAVGLARGLGAEVTVLSWMGPEGEAALRQALALGATAAVRLHRADPLSAEPWLDPDPGRTARVLAGYLGEHPAEAILCGGASEDQGRAAVGPMLAELLGLPLASGVVGVRREDEALVAECHHGAQRVTVRLGIPALLTVGEDAPRPARPSVMALARAMRAPLEVVEAPAPASLVTAHALVSAERRRPLREALEASTVEEACHLLLARLRERRVL
ncbi:MAG: hypothetical protein AB1503_10165 [Bacillota bacterium]